MFKKIIIRLSRATLVLVLYPFIAIRFLFTMLVNDLTFKDLDDIIK